MCGLRIGSIVDRDPQKSRQLHRKVTDAALLYKSHSNPCDFLFISFHLLKAITKGQNANNMLNKDKQCIIIFIFIYL